MIERSVLLLRAGWCRLAFAVLPFFQFRRLRAPAMTVLAAFCMLSSTTASAAEVHDQHVKATFSDYDFLTNYGEYMPRIHCLQTAAGAPDWPWIAAMIVLNLVVLAGYLRIFRFWKSCYTLETGGERDGKLMDLAWIFLLCGICGYGLPIVIFFWPVYRLLTIALLGLAVLTWRFAYDLTPFGFAFTSHRLQRELDESLQRESDTQDAHNSAIEHAEARTERTRKELHATDKELEEFVYAASHDLKSPLRAIESLSEFIIEDAGSLLPEGPQNDLEEIRTRVRRMSRMLDGLLNYSRNRTSDSEAEAFTSTDVYHESVEILNIPSHITVSYAGPDIVMFAPRPPLELILRNLVDNAVKHHDKEYGHIQVRASDRDQLVQFEVEDDGPGIPQQYQKQVFGMFQTLKRRDEFDSNGMGLALVKRIVESHGGTIAVESDGQTGTLFRFTFPAVFEKTAVRTKQTTSHPSLVQEQETATHA